MEILQVLTRESALAKKRFLVIGGHALNFHGISRTTGDLDLMVEREDLNFWRAILLRLHYTIYHETSAFIQSKSNDLAAWPIDLMLVGSETMEKAMAEAVVSDTFGCKIYVASVGNLIAMKLHGLKANQAHRMQKDQGDLFELLEIAKLSPLTEAFRQLCLKYANLEVYERLRKIADP